jgi:dephospho-CoA kinase
MKTLAITGGIACGKSLVGRVLQDRGFPVCEADELGHALLDRSSSVYPEIIAEFGSQILGADGAIDRGRLGREIFAHDDKRIRLNRLIHPQVNRMWLEWLVAREAEGARMGVVIIPLMYEIGLDEPWTAVVCVAAPREAQAERMRLRGWTEDDAAGRLRAQWPLEVKMERADFVIYNGGTIEMMSEQLDRVLKTFLGDY